MFLKLTPQEGSKQESPLSGHIRITPQSVYRPSESRQACLGGLLRWWMAITEREKVGAGEPQIRKLLKKVCNSILSNDFQEVSHYFQRFSNCSWDLVTAFGIIWSFLGSWLLFDTWKEFSRNCGPYASRALEFDLRTKTILQKKHKNNLARLFLLFEALFALRGCF